MTWTLLQQDSGASVAGVYTSYRLFGYALPGDAAPSPAWYIERTQTTASHLGGGTADTLTYASWAKTPGQDSASAWADRATLAYDDTVRPDTYAGDPALNPTVNATGGGGALEIVDDEHKLIQISKDDGWVEVSTEMEAGKVYRFKPKATSTVFVKLSETQPTDMTAGTEIGEARQDNDPDRKFAGTLLWVRTMARTSITLRLMELG